MAFVQAVDDRFYKNPIISGTDWWVNFDDGPEIAVRMFPRSTPASCKARASNVMRKAEMEFKELRWSEAGESIFPPTWEKFFDACRFSFKLLAPIPLPAKYDVVVDEPGAVWDHSLYGFYSDVSSEDCARAVLGMDIHPLIARALLAQAVYKKEQEKVRPEIAKKLYVMAPWLRELKRSTWQEQLKDKPGKIRIHWRV